MTFSSWWTSFQGEGGAIINRDMGKVGILALYGYFGWQKINDSMKNDRCAEINLPFFLICSQIFFASKRKGMNKRKQAGLSRATLEISSEFSTCFPLITLQSHRIVYVSRSSSIRYCLIRDLCSLWVDPLICKI